MRGTLTPRSNLNAKYAYNLYFTINTKRKIIHIKYENLFVPFVP